MPALKIRNIDNNPQAIKQSAAFQFFSINSAIAVTKGQILILNKKVSRAEGTLRSANQWL